MAKDSIPRARPEAQKGGPFVRSLFLAIGLFCCALGVFAFWPYIAGLSGFPSLVHAHAVAMAGWMLLFLGQVFFAWRGQIGTHIMYGKAARWFTIPVCIMGLAMGYHKLARVAKAGGKYCMILSRCAASADLRPLSPF